MDCIEDTITEAFWDFIDEVPTYLMHSYKRVYHD